MIVLSSAVVLVLVLLAYTASTVGRRDKRLPPGPPTVPFLGNLLQVPTKRTHLKFRQWAKDYGGIFSLKMGSGTAIVITSPDLIKRLVDKKSNIYSHRPDALVGNIIGGGDHVLLMQYSDQWRTCRKLIHQYFTESVVMKQHLKLVNAEAVQMMYDFVVEPDGHMRHPKRFSNSIIMSLVYGSRTPSIKTVHMRKLYDLMENWSKVMEPGNTPPVDIFPFLKWVPEGLMGNWRSRAEDVRNEMNKLYGETQGKENAFGGAAFVVESREDLDRASSTLPHATSIQKLDAPGGGERVTFYDPVDGFPFHLVYGQQSREASADYPELPLNYPSNKHSEFKRMKPGPAPVHKLGHFGACVTDFAKSFEFYTTKFNFKPSDIFHDAEGRDITTFMHLDRGMEEVDHHSFFFFEGPKFHVHHSSFEVHDFDIQSLGHQWLRDKDYTLEWGVGRHVLGSQIFDYWRDTSNFIVEHYADGDLVNELTPTSRIAAGADTLHIWGPPLPPTFLD